MAETPPLLVAGASCPEIEKGIDVPAKQTPDLRHLGHLRLLGMVAGAGVRYYIASRARDTSTRLPPRLIDWEQARKVALRVSQWEQHPIRNRAARRTQYTDLVQR